MYLYKQGVNILVNYSLMKEQLRALADGVPYLVSNLSNACALIYDTLDRLNWAGFYLMQDGGLVLGPFQGKTACTQIAVGKGVCGTSVFENRTIRVDNVHEFPGHIACDSASNSEIVIPLRLDGKVIGVLDIDSPEFSRFSEEDQKGLEEFVSVLENIIKESKLFSAF